MMLYILSGAPGSGKTTLSINIADKQDAIRFSFDELGCFRHKELIPHIIEALQDEKNVVVDALFTRISQRKLILEATKNIDCKKILIYMDTPLEECICRNAQRPNPLPDFMVRDIYKSIELPAIDEGWDDIWYYK
jgi:tRNA uridine 5-carbamoylmethylation protein Kti12